MSDLQAELNRLAGIFDNRLFLDAQGAANQWAGLTAPNLMDMVGALNYRAGIKAPGLLGLEGVLNYLAGTTGLGDAAAAARITGRYGLRLPGTAGNYISTPDSVLNSVTGDIDIRVCVKMTSWSNNVITNGSAWVGKWGSSQNSFFFGINQAQRSFQFAWSSTGANQTFAQSTVGNTFVDGTVGWVRVTFDVDNGAGGNDVKFYTSIDGITWTQLGATVTTAGIAQIFDATSPLDLGADNASGTSRYLDGTIYYAEVRNGIDGPVVVKFDSSQVQVSGAATPATINGWTWNGSALYKRDDYVHFDGTDGNYLSYPDTAANSVTGDIDIRLRYDDDDTSTLSKGIIGKFSNGNRAWFIRHNASTANRLEALFSVDGTTAIAVSATVDTPAGTKWVRVTRVAATGVVTFYTAPDGVTWTQLSQATATSGNLFDNTQAIEVGRDTSNTGRGFKGNVYYAEVRNGINGPVVASFSAQDNQIQTPWTINGSGWNWEGASFTGKPGIAYSHPPTAGNYASTPDTAGNSITGDIDIRVKAMANHWSDPPNRQCLVGKWIAGSSQRSYALSLSSVQGKLNFLSSVAGTAGISTESSTTHTLVNGQVAWVRGTLAVSTGTISFYTSTDGITWTPVGTPVVIGATSIFDSTTQLQIGERDTSDFFDGTIYYAEVRNGIDGPIVAKFDPTNMAKTGTRLPTSTVQPGGSPNLLTPNTASIETDASGWGSGTNAPTLARDTSQFLDGVACLSMTATATGPTGMNALGVPYTQAKVVPGKSYTIKGSSRAAVVSRTFGMQINWLDSAGAYMSTFSSPQLANTTTGWTEAAGTVVAPAGAAYAQVACYFPTASNVLLGEVYYFDRISLVEASEVWTLNGSAWDLVNA